MTERDLLQECAYLLKRIHGTLWVVMKPGMTTDLCKLSVAIDKILIPEPTPQQGINQLIPSNS